MIRPSEILAASAVVALMLGYGAWSDRQLLAQADAAHELRVADVCGTAGELARLSDGFACLHEKPSGRLVALPLPSTPVRVAHHHAGQ